MYFPLIFILNTKIKLVFLIDTNSASFDKKKLNP